MTEEEYLLLPLHPGWKVEYVDGEAVFWPRESVAFGTLAVHPHSPIEVNDVALRPPDASDEAALLELFRAAFDDTPEYAAWPLDRFHEDAQQIVGSFNRKLATTLAA